MWQAILDRREVAVLGNGKMMGPELYRNSLELMLIDRIFLRSISETGVSHLRHQ